jgi:WD40 repeat protein
MSQTEIKTVSISVPILRRRYLEKLYEHLPKVDADRFEAILPLFEKDRAPSVADCANALFARRSVGDALPLLRAFRDRIKKAGRSAGSHLTLEVDTRKRIAAEKRLCWFEAFYDAAESVAEFSRSSADLDSPDLLKSRAVTTTGAAMEAEKRAVDFFVSSAEADRVLAEELLNQLRVLFKTSKTYAYDTWDRSRILVGEDREMESAGALQRAAFVLVLVSPDFLGDESCCQELQLVLSTPGKAVIPVVLSDILEERQDLQGLEKSTLFYLHSDRGPARSYAACPGHQRTQFTLSLFREIERRLDSILKPQSAARRAERLEFKRHRFGDEEARELAPRETDFFTETRLSFTSLEIQDLDNDALERHAAHSEPALDALEKWALEKDGPIFAALLGEYGMGKTTTLKQFTHRLLDRRKQDPSVPLPIFIDLRAYSETIRRHEVPELRAFLEEIFRHTWKSPERVAIDPEDVIRLVREEGAILIFDGLDEKLVHLDDGQARAFMRQLWSALPPQVFRRSSPQAAVDSGKRVGKLVLSCRSHYFKTIRDQGAMLRGEDRDGVRASDYRACILLPFDEYQVRDYLTQDLKDPLRVDAALDLFAAVHNLKDLSRRPYLLSLIAGQIGRLEARRARGELVLGVTLYETVVEEWLNRDEGKHYLHKEDKRRLMEDLAAAMWSSGAREWPWQQVRDWLGRRVAEEAVLRARYLGDPNKAAILDEDFRTATFVLRPDTSMDSFRFAHTSLHEFFLAGNLYRALLDCRLNAWSVPMPSLETLDFLGQLIAVETRPGRNEDARAALATLLANYRPLATEAAFRYRLLALERGWPEPAPGCVDLRGADLSGWSIAGRNEKERLNLRGAVFEGANLSETRWDSVDLSGADLMRARLLRAEFHHVFAETLDVSESDLTATQWRSSSVRQLIGGDGAQWYAARWMDCDTDPSELGIDFSKEGSLSRCRVSSAMVQSFPIPGREQASLHVEVGHSDKVLACAWSPDGTRLLSGSSDNTLKVWDARSGECLLTLQNDASSVACAWSPDGRRILSGFDHLKVWDARSGECLLTLQGHAACVRACAWSPDGTRLLSGSDDKTLRVWDARSSQCLLTLRGHAGFVWSCTWSPDSARLLSGSEDKTLKVWDARSGQDMLTLRGHTNRILSCAWSPDGTRLLSGSEDKTLKVWDARSGECLLTLQGHAASVRSCVWSPDGTLIFSGSEDKTLRVWDARSGQCLLTLQGHAASVWACAWSPDGTRLLSGSWDNTLRVWDARSGECLLTLQGHAASVWACAWSPDGRHLLSGSDDKSLRVWNALSGHCLLTLQGHTARVSACAWSPDGMRLLSCSEQDNTPKVWDAVSGQCLLTLQGHSKWARACAWSPDGTRLLSGSNDKTLRVWDAASGQCLLTLEGHAVFVWACAWSPDGTRLLSDSIEGTLKVWDAESGRCLLTLQSTAGWLWTCAWSPDGTRFVSGSEDKLLRVWDAPSGQCFLILQGHAARVLACSWSPDGTRILSGSADKTLKVWDARSGQCLMTLKGHVGSVLACAWSPDGTRLLSGSSDNTLKVWDAASGREVMTLVLGPNGQTAALDFEHGRILAASPEAWRFVSWRYFDEETQRLRLLPADHFEPLPCLKSGAAS